MDAAGPREARDALALKSTLLMRPLAALLGNPHKLAGFLGLHDGRMWKRAADGTVSFSENPIELLVQLYHFLHLDPDPERAPSQTIWDHDQRILDDALSFYGELSERLGTKSWAELCEQLEREAPPKAFAEHAGLWSRARAAHAGFQLGMELLLIVPRAGQAADFFDLTVAPDLSVSYPEACLDAGKRAALQRKLAPPPPASSDEVVTPMGGHFYSREAPHLAPLVEEGSRFEAGEPLFVIEVMKMFNKISVPYSGRVTKVLLHDSDGTIVKKGQPILKIEPDERVVIESPETIAERRRQVTARLLGAGS
jgi:biotin carboxyl carrier protein